MLAPELTISGAGHSHRKPRRLLIIHFQAPCFPQVVHGGHELEGFLRGLPEPQDRCRTSRSLPPLKVRKTEDAFSLSAWNTPTAAE